MSAAARTALIAALAAAPFLLLGLGAVPFDDPGEGMHAQIAHELRAGGDPLALSLAGVRYVDKPPLLYALVAGAFALAGEREATARAVPALAAVAAVAATAWLGARLLGGMWGLLAGGALLTSAGFFAYGRYVRPDALFVAGLAWGFALALAGLMEERRALVVAGFGCFGLAALAKDPLGAVAPPLAIGAALGLCGRARPVARWLPPAGVALAAALAFGWWALAETRTPGFAWYTVVDNHVLAVPDVRAAADQVHGHGHEAVDPGPSRVGLVTRVVLDVEPDARRGHPQHEGQEQPLQRGRGPEDQQGVGGREDGQDDRGLQVHLPAVAGSPAGAAQELVDPALQFEVKGVVGAELQPQRRSFHLAGSPQAGRAGGILPGGGNVTVKVVPRPGAESKPMVPP